MVNYCRELKHPALGRGSRVNGPILGAQILNFEEVAIPGHKDHPVAFRRGGDPDVILGKGPPFLLQGVFESPVFPRDFQIG